MKKLKKGFSEAVIGVLVGLGLTFAVNFLADKDIIPRQAVTIYGMVALVLNIFTLNSLGSVGIVYTVGWLAGSLLFMSVMSEQDIIINIVIPVILLLIRFYQQVKKLAR